MQRVKHEKEKEQAIKDQVRREQAKAAAEAGIMLKGENEAVLSKAAQEKVRQKKIDRMLQAEREEIEKEAKAFEKKQQRKAEKAEAEMREKVRLKQAADRQAEREEAKRVRKEMEEKTREVLAREAAVKKDKEMDALKERKAILAKKEADEEYAAKQLADWKKRRDELQEQDLQQRHKEKAEVEAAEKAARKAALSAWKEQEAERIAAEKAAEQKHKDELRQFHEHQRQKAMEEEIMRLQREIDHEQVLTDAAKEQAAVAKAKEEAVKGRLSFLDQSVSDLMGKSGLKLW